MGKNKKLSQMIIKMLNNQACHSHPQKVTHYNPITNTLTCIQCPSSQNHSLPLPLILQNPIHLMTSNTLQPSFYTYFSHNNQSQSQLQNIKNGLYTIMDNIQQKIMTYCSEIKNRFEQIYNKIKETNKLQIQQLRQIEIQYREEFQVLVSERFNKGTQEELVGIFQEFRERNVDPSHSLVQKITRVYQQYQQLPKINWESLQRLYCKVTDPTIWQIPSIFQPQQSSPPASNHQAFLKQIHHKNNQQSRIKILLPNIPNPLYNPEYSFRYTSSKIFLLKNTHNNNNIHPQTSKASITSSPCLSHNDSLDFNTNYPYKSVQNREEEQQGQIVYQFDAEHDQYYQIAQYQIIGVNYHGLTLYGYVYGRIVQVARYEVRGCTQVLKFGNCFIVIAGEQLVRLWLDGVQEILGDGYQSICYASQNQDSFICENTDKQLFLRSVQHDCINYLINSQESK